MYSQTVSQSGRTVHTSMYGSSRVARQAVRGLLPLSCLQRHYSKGKSCCSSGSCSCSFFGQPGGGRLWCRLQVQVQVAGWACRWLSCERTDSNCPPARARLTQHVHFTQPPFRQRCGNHREGSPLHVRGSVAVLAGEFGGTGTAIFRALAILFAPRGTRLIHSPLGPRSGSCAVRLSALSMNAKSDNNRGGLLRRSLV